jgi:hypothetical protein
MSLGRHDTYALSDHRRQRGCQSYFGYLKGDRTASFGSRGDEQGFPQRARAAIGAAGDSDRGSVAGLSGRHLSRLVPVADTHEDAQDEQHRDGERRTPVN